MRLASVPFLCTCIACVYLAGCRDENTTPAAVRAARVVVVTRDYVDKMPLAALKSVARLDRYQSKVQSVVYTLQHSE
jgi:hypothetical protein